MKYPPSRTSQLRDRNEARVNKKWPTMRTITIKPRHDADLAVDATVDVMSGRPVVAVASGRPMTEDLILTPAEASRLARALLRAASCCRAKSAARAALAKVRP